MEKYLYRDLSIYEKTHWWHLAKTETIFGLLQKYLQKTRVPKILDMGCGTGNNIEMWNALGEAYGVDPSEEAIRFCKKKGIKRIFKGSCEKTSLSSFTFDCVTMLDVLEHIENEDNALKEIGRLLKKNGILILTVPAFKILWSRWDEVLHHKRRYSKKTLLEVLTRNKFSVEFISYQYAFLFSPAYIVRKVKSFVYKNRSYPSDFSHTNHFVNILLLRLYRLEMRAMRLFPLPIGTTLLCVARKNI